VKSIINVLIGDSTPESRKTLSRFLKHMPRSKDSTLIILKGHLLIEQEINDILDSHLPNSKYIYDANTSFRDRFAIIKAIYGQDKSFPYEQIDKLNSLRNRLVHNLEPKDLENKIDDFLNKSLAMFPDRLRKLSIDQRLKFALALICGNICNYKESHSVSNPLAKS
jgi:hypothetical protein